MSHCGRSRAAASKLLAREGEGRARPRQRHVGDRGGLADVPMAYAIAAVAFRQVHVDVLLVVAVRTGAEYRHEARAGARPHALAKLARARRVGRMNGPAVGKPDRANVERIRLAVLAQLRSGHTVHAAAVV